MNKPTKILLSCLLLVILALLIRRNVQETKLLADVIVGKLCVSGEYQYIFAEESGIIVPTIKIYYPPYNATSDNQFEETAQDIAKFKAPFLTWRLLVFVKDTRLEWQSAADVKKNESDIPRQADISVSGLYLSNPDSIRKILGTSVTPIEPDNGFPIALVCNSKSAEELTLVFHYGSYRDSYDEFRVRSISTTPPNCIDSPKGVNHFITGKGIRLGISKRELLNILGPDFSEKKEDHLITIQYKIDNVDTSRFMQKYDWPLYYGSYHFSKDKLVKFEFGFIYP